METLRGIFPTPIMDKIFRYTGNYYKLRMLNKKYNMHVQVNSITIRDNRIPPESCKFYDTVLYLKLEKTNNFNCCVFKNLKVLVADNCCDISIIGCGLRAVSITSCENISGVNSQNTESLYMYSINNIKITGTFKDLYLENCADINLRNICVDHLKIIHCILIKFEGKCVINAIFTHSNRYSILSDDSLKLSEIIVSEINICDTTFEQPEIQECKSIKTVYYCNADCMDVNTETLENFISSLIEEYSILYESNLMIHIKYSCIDAIVPFANLKSYIPLWTNQIKSVI